MTLLLPSLCRILAVLLLIQNNAIVIAECLLHWLKGVDGYIDRALDTSGGDLFDVSCNVYCIIL
jgi:hypothetical protein